MTGHQTNTVRERFLATAVEMLREGDLFERETAVNVLGRLGDDRFIPILLDTLQHDRSRRLQHKAAQAAARIGGDVAMGGLQDLMYVDNPFTRFLAAEALATMIGSGT